MNDDSKVLKLRDTKQRLQSMGDNFLFSYYHLSSTQELVLRHFLIAISLQSHVWELRVYRIVNKCGYKSVSWEF